LAFRYVANELDVVEANEFESLLLTDQVAREAVAAAVQETTHIHQALGVIDRAASQRSNWNRKTTRVAIIAVGSCLTLFLALCLIRSSLPMTDGVAHQTVANDSSGSSAQLAYAWAEARNGLSELQPVANTLLADSLEMSVIAEINSESESALVAPSWMLAALAKMDSGIDSEFEIQE
jgi:hypothetical protein